MEPTKKSRDHELSGSADSESSDARPAVSQAADGVDPGREDQPPKEASSPDGPDEASSRHGEVAEEEPETGGEDGGTDEDAPRAGGIPVPEDIVRKHREKHRSLLPDAWQVRLPVFEGPLDLLLHLIRINEVEIVDIPVALICDQYHEYLDLMESLDLDVAGEYIYEAAILIQLKSRLLLPQPKVEEGEEPPADPREELVQRLLEYQKIKEAAQTLAEVSNVRSGLWTRDPKKVEKLTGAPEGELEIGDLSLFDLLKVFRRVLDRYDREHPPEIVLRGETFSVRDQIDRWVSRLAGGKPVDLIDEMLAMSCRGEAIATFLAILEMGKLQLIRLHLADSGDVLIYRTAREFDASEIEGEWQ